MSPFVGEKEENPIGDARSPGDLVTQDSHHQRGLPELLHLLHLGATFKREGLRFPYGGQCCSAIKSLTERTFRTCKAR